MPLNKISMIILEILRAEIKNKRNPSLLDNFIKRWNASKGFVDYYNSNGVSPSTPTGPIAPSGGMGRIP